MINKYQTYRQNKRAGIVVIAVTSKNVLQAGTKYPIRGIIDAPTAQNIFDPFPSHERYFSVVNSVRSGN